jgi:Spy/CpxP family protein refolding chaperone
MNSKMIIAVLVITAVVLSGTALYADQSCGKSGKGSAGKAEFGKRDPFKGLDLTDEQKRMLKENKARNKDAMKTLYGSMKAQKDLMRQELQKPKIDMAKITQINGEIKKLHAEMLDHRLQGILEVRKILSPEQFKKFNDKTEKQWKHCKMGKNK